MTHQPPIPAGNQSPYPLHEPPHTIKPAGPPAINRDADRSVANGTVAIVGVVGVVAIGAIAAAGWAWLRRTAPAAAPRKRAAAKKPTRRAAPAKRSPRKTAKPTG